MYGSESEWFFYTWTTTLVRAACFADIMAKGIVGSRQGFALTNAADPPVRAGPVKKIWCICSKHYDDLRGIDRRFQWLDGAVVSTPVNGGSNSAKTPPVAAGWAPNDSCSGTAPADDGGLPNRALKSTSVLLLTVATQPRTRLWIRPPRATHFERRSQTRCDDEFMLPSENCRAAVQAAPWGISRKR